MENAGTVERNLLRSGLVNRLYTYRTLFMTAISLIERIVETELWISRYLLKSTNPAIETIIGRSVLDELRKKASKTHAKQGIIRVSTS